MCFLWSVASTSSAAAGWYKTALEAHLSLLLAHHHHHLLLLFLPLLILGHLFHLVPRSLLVLHLPLGLLNHRLAHLALLLICLPNLHPHSHPVLLLAHLILLLAQLVLLVAHLVVLPGLLVAHLDLHLLSILINMFTGPFIFSNPIFNLCNRDRCWLMFSNGRQCWK